MVIVGLVSVFLDLFFGLDPATEPGAAAAVALSAQFAITLLGVSLLLLGLVGLYARQSEAAGDVGLVGFLVVFLALVHEAALAPGGVVWPALLADLGWAAFGISSLRARIYPPAAAQLLIVGAVIGAVVNFLLMGGGIGRILFYAGVGAALVLHVAVAWLGFALFAGRDGSAEQPQPQRAG